MHLGKNQGIDMKSTGWKRDGEKREAIERRQRKGEGEREGGKGREGRRERENREGNSTLRSKPGSTH